MSEAKKRTIKEDIRMVMRGIKILSKEFGSGIFISAILKQVVQSTRNLPNIYLSALVINEIAGECRQKEVIKLAIITVLVNAAVQFVKSLLDRWNNYYIEFMWASSRNIYSKKMFEMDYVDADNVKNHELFAQIMQNNNFGTYGLIRVYTILPSLLGGIAQIAGSAALTVSLFTAKIETNTAMSFLNSPIAVLVVLALMLISVIMPPYLYNKTEKVKFNINKRMVEWDKTLAFYGLKMPYEKERAKDVRLYKQEFSIQKMAEYSISELFKEYTRTTYLKSIVLGQIIKLVYTVFI